MKSEVNPWDGLPSIWDGWERQCFDTLHSLGDSHCALGWLEKSNVVRIDEIYGNLELRFLNTDVQRRLVRVQSWLERYVSRSIAVTNDYLHWTPEQFRDLDRRLEYEYLQAQLGKQIDAIGISKSAPQAEPQCSVTAGDSGAPEEELIEV